MVQEITKEANAMMMISPDLFEYTEDPGKLQGLSALDRLCGFQEETQEPVNGQRAQLLELVTPGIVGVYSDVLKSRARQAAQMGLPEQVRFIEDKYEEFAQEYVTDCDWLGEFENARSRGIFAIFRGTGQFKLNEDDSQFFDKIGGLAWDTHKLNEICSLYVRNGGNLSDVISAVQEIGIEENYSEFDIDLNYDQLRTNLAADRLGMLWQNIIKPYEFSEEGPGKISDLSLVMTSQKEVVSLAKEMYDLPKEEKLDLLSLIRNTHNLAGQDDERVINEAIYLISRSIGGTYTQAHTLPDFFRVDNGKILEEGLDCLYTAAEHLNDNDMPEHAADLFAVYTDAVLSQSDRLHHDDIRRVLADQLGEISELIFTYSEEPEVLEEDVEVTYGATQDHKLKIVPVREGTNLQVNLKEIISLPVDESNDNKTEIKFRYAKETPLQRETSETADQLFDLFENVIGSSDPEYSYCDVDEVIGYCDAMVKNSLMPQEYRQRAFNIMHDFTYNAALSAVEQGDQEQTQILGSAYQNMAIFNAELIIDEGPEEIQEALDHIMAVYATTTKN